MTRVVVTETAKADISDIVDFLESEAGPHTAETYARSFRDALDRLPPSNCGRRMRMQ